MATVAFQYNILSATAFPLHSNADYILKTPSISSFWKKVLRWLMATISFILTCQKSFTALIVNVTIDMSIMKTYLACRRAIHSKVIITFTCFEGKMESINKT